MTDIDKLNNLWSLRWVARPVATLLPCDEREEWLGDLEEIHHWMLVEDKHPTWLINVIISTKTLSLTWAAVGVYIVDLLSNSESSSSWRSHLRFRYRLPHLEDLIPLDDREEWLGDLEEERCHMLDKAEYPKWVIEIIIVRKILRLLWSAVQTRIIDLFDQNLGA